MTEKSFEILLGIHLGYVSMIEDLTIISKTNTLYYTDKGKVKRNYR